MSEPKNWRDAQTFCKDKFTDLATVDTKEDMDKIVQLTQYGGFSGEVWIGLYMDTWRWSLNQSSFYGEGEMGYRDWHSGEPQNSGGEECCVEIWDRKWNDFPCRGVLHFVCYDGEFKQCHQQHTHTSKHGFILITHLGQSLNVT